MSRRPVRRAASRASARYASRSTGSMARKCASTVREIAALDRTSERGGGPEPQCVVDGRAHERSEGLDRDTARRREPLHLTHQRHDVVRGDRRGRVVARALRVRHHERAQAELLGERHDFGIARDRGPRSREPVQSRGGRRERLQRMHGGDAHVGTQRQQLVEDVEPARSRDVHDECTALERRRGGDGRGLDRAVRRRDEDDFRTLARPPKRASRSWPSTRPPRSSMRSPGRARRPRRHAIRDRRARARESCPRGRDQSAQQCDCRRPPSVL